MHCERGAHLGKSPCDREADAALATHSGHERRSSIQGEVGGHAWMVVANPFGASTVIWPRDPPAVIWAGKSHHLSTWDPVDFHHTDLQSA